MPRSSSLKLHWLILVALVSRITLNTAWRFVYPFAPALSRGLSVPLQAITTILAANQITGLLALMCGPLSDRWGYRRILLVGLGLLAVGLFVGGLFPFYGIVFGGLVLASLGKSLFDPAIQAYAGAQVSYQRRGLAMGLIELGWAGSSLIGIPLVGLLIDARDWRSPFFVLGTLALVSLAGVFVLIPEAPKPTVTHVSGRSLLTI